MIILHTFSITLPPKHDLNEADLTNIVNDLNTRVCEAVDRVGTKWSVALDLTTGDLKTEKCSRGMAGFYCAHCNNSEEFHEPQESPNSPPIRM